MTSFYLITSSKALAPNSHWGASTLTCELRRGQNPVHNTPFGMVTGSRMASIPVRVHEMQGNVYSDFWERGVSFPPLDLVVFRYETCSSCSHSYAMRKANSTWNHYIEEGRIKDSRKLYPSTRFEPLDSTPGLTILEPIKCLWLYISLRWTSAMPNIKIPSGYNIVSFFSHTAKC